MAAQSGAPGLSVCLLPLCLPFCVLTRQDNTALRLGAQLRSCPAGWATLFPDRLSTGLVLPHAGLPHEPWRRR